MAPRKKKTDAAEIDLDAELGSATIDAEQKALVRKAVEEAAAIALRIEKGSALLKDLKEQLHKITTETLPATMARAGTSLYAVDDGPMIGWKVEVKPFVGGALIGPKPDDDEAERIEKTKKREAAFEWFRSVEAGDLIKNILVAEFGKGEDNKAGEVKEKLNEIGVNFEITTSIHPQTLLSFVRERMKNGEEVPLEDLGLFAGRNAKLSPPKEPKKKKGDPND